MASVELATAYVSLVPTLKGAQGAIARELGAVDADGIGKDVGGRMGGGIAGTLKGLVGPAIAAAAAVGLGSFVAEAAAASDATDKFKSTMNFAGIDTSGIEKASAAAKAYADQTVYDLPTIQATMAQLASNGVSGYTELTEAAGNLNAVAGGNAETFKSVSRTLTQSAGAGKLMTEDWNMLADAIPGASGPLQDIMREAGAFEGNFKKAMENGQISSEEFQAAISKLGNDPIAVEAARSVTTFEGSIGGLKATINSGLMGALDAMKPAITGAINLLSGGLGKAFELTGQAAQKLAGPVSEGVAGVVASVKLLTTGDFQGGIFGLEEDSGFVTFLFDVRDGFGQLMTAVSPLATQAFSLWSAISPLQTIFAALLPHLGPLVGIFGTLAGSLGGALMSAITGILPAVQTLQGVFISLFTDVLATVLPVIVQLVGMFAGTLSSLVPILVPIVVQIVTLAATLISQLAPIFMQLVSTVMPMVVTIFGAILSAIGPLVSMIAGILIPIIQALMPVVVTVFSVVADIIGSVMQYIQGIIQVVTGIISGNWSQAWAGIGNIFGGIWNTIVAVVGGAIGIVWSVISSGLGLVLGFVGSTLANIGRFFSDTWNNVVTGVSSMIGNVVGFFGGLIGKITGAIGNAGSALFQTGKDIIQGLIDGISGMMGSIGRAVLNIVPEAIRGPFEDLLGIASPSKVFRGYGVNIGQGLILGIDDMHGRIEDAVTGMVSVPQTSTYGVATAGGDYRTSGALGGQTFNIYETDDPIATSHAVARRQSALAI